MFKIEPNTFICADSIEVLREIKDKVFDLCLTDPPYGINADKMTMGKGSRNDTNKNIKKNWDCSPIDISVINNIIAISTNQIIWGGNYYYLRPSRCWLLWDKLDYNSDFASHEMAWTSYDSVVKCFQRARNCGDEIKYHPTQKPVALFVWCLLNYSKPGDLVIDPFCGSGTTALACHKTGRKFLCIDKDEEYIEIAKQRYADLIAQQDLFIQPAQDKTEQINLF
jgi:DNA modification methylase